MFKVPNEFRLRNHVLLGSTNAIGNNGLFIIPHYKILDYELRCQASDGEGWEHVSVSVGRKRKEPTRCPTWIEMCYIKDLFWHREDVVIQFHPAEKDYINMHEYVLHLWRPINMMLPIPNPILVGLKS